MTLADPVAAAYAALDDCEAALTRLDELCCEPGRSPRMAAVAKTLATARAGMASGTAGTDAAGLVVAALEDAGGQVGRLQVGCCAPPRMPLYARLLDGLTRAQLAVTAAGRDH